jgi:hypothetical protein
MLEKEIEEEDENEIIIPYVASITTYSKLIPDAKTAYYSFFIFTRKI